MTIEIIGGAALRLAYIERATTVDIDARLSPEQQLAPIIRDIAAERAWPDNWLNSDAEQFIPRWGRDVHWRTLWTLDGVTISVASPEALLAMKLHAVQHRGNRDIGDVAKLLTIVGVDSVDEAEELYGEFYPGDEFTPRTYERVERVFMVGLPAAESPPPAPFADEGLL
ncbi:nucleotidyl transferase AbiEii/AbiGii toxin family protein [Microcella indica]|uniref:nucleotidyl transferase AbiEii/AbiGii toxin family protein n=1 Tax=Microcella indica TaxID=2750620 RepID=UPI0032AF856F